MNKNIVSILLGSLFFLFLQCSRCEEAPMPVVCENGYENQSDVCVCPPGKFQAPKGNYGDYDTCRVLKPNEYYSITTGCPCEDTIFFKITELPDGKYEVTTNKFRYGAAGGATPLKYFKLPSGDSLVTELAVWEPCGSGILPKFIGKFVAPDVIKGKVLYISSFDSQVKDSCIITFHR